MANKSLLIVGGICMVIALASFGIAYASGASGIEDVESVNPEEFILGPGTSFSYTYTAEMNEFGAAGWYIMMNGDYLDDDGDGRTDACQNITFTVTDSQGVDVTEDASEFSCTAPSDDEKAFSDEWFDPIPGDGRILFAYVCATIDTETGYDCTVDETYTIASDSQIYVMDKAAFDDAYLEGGLKLLGGVGLAGVGSCCCGLGGILLLIGLFTNGKSTTTVGMIPLQGGVPGMQAPAHGNQPVEQMPTQQYTVGADIDSSSVADTPVSVWDN